MRKHHAKRLLAALCATAALVLADAVPATAAAAGCGSSCDGKDPATYKIWSSSSAYHYCADDAGTVGYATTGRENDYSVELRYSPRCRTIWARTGSRVHFWVERRSPYLYADAYPNVDGSTVHTLMLNDRNYVSRACYDYPAGGTICSDWY